MVSVIITTRNEEHNIKDCLQAILAQDYSQESLEIIVVDNGSSDRTKEIAKEYTGKIYDCGPERSAQRNFGVQQARGEYILYLDADMNLSAHVVSECVKRCERGGLVALYIPERIVGRGFWARVRDFERSFYNATCIDCVRFVRRDKFLEIGGFDEALTGPEDWDFDRRIRQNGEADIISSPLYHDEGVFSFRRYINKKSYYMRWFDKYVQKWGKDDIIIRKQLGFYYRFLGAFTEEGKWKRLFKHPLLTAGMYCLRMLVGISFIFLKNKEDGILMITPFFSPNVGGVEAHLDSLCEYLSKKDKSVYVVTYQPITVKRKGLYLERRGSVEIRRYPWFGKDLFSKLERHFFLNLFYISTGIFLYAFSFLLLKGRKIRVIHAHGLNAALVS
ncbi:MAG: glycosyltransferase, partial [bacterium]